MTEQRATWTDAQESALLAFLLEHKAEAGDGANFKTATWNEAAAMLEKMPYTGKSKTGTSCKTKWSKVSGDTDSHASC